MLPMKEHLVIYGFLVSFKLFCIITTVTPVFRNTEVFKVNDPIPLCKSKIRSIWLMGTENIIFIWFLVLIVNVI